MAKMNFEDFYVVSSLIAKGSYGNFYRCFSKEGNEEELAVKITNNDQNNTQSGGENGEHREAAIWRRLLHSNILEFKRSFKSPEKSYIVLESFESNTLFEQIVQFTTYTERDGSFFMYQLLSALNHLRQKRVIHRDITAENLVIHKTPHGEILKLCDFAMAVRLDKGVKSVSMDANGTPLYLCPEIVLRKDIGYAVDCWSAGVILYLMLGGYPPFWSENTDDLLRHIVKTDVRFPSPFWEQVSDSAKNLIVELLEKDPTKRLSAKEAIEHPWLLQPERLPAVHRRKTVDKLQEFNARRKLRSAIFSVQMLSRLTRLSQDKADMGEPPVLDDTIFLNFPYKDSVLEQPVGKSRKTSCYTPRDLTEKQQEILRRNSEGSLLKKALLSPQMPLLLMPIQKSDSRPGSPGSRSPGSQSPERPSSPNLPRSPNNRPLSPNRSPHKIAQRKISQGPPLRKLVELEEEEHTPKSLTDSISSYFIPSIPKSKSSDSISDSYFTPNKLDKDGVYPIWNQTNPIMNDKPKEIKKSNASGDSKENNVSATNAVLNSPTQSKRALQTSTLYCNVTMDPTSNGAPKFSKVTLKISPGQIAIAEEK